MMQVHMLISGYVQSVGFRRFVKKYAFEFGLTGWVRNLSDRRVEVLAQGEKDSLEKLILLCRKGPFMAEVDSVSVDWASVGGSEEFTGFELRGTR